MTIVSYRNSNLRVCKHRSQRYELESQHDPTPEVKVEVTHQKCKYYKGKKLDIYLLLLYYLDDRSRIGLPPGTSCRGGTVDVPNENMPDLTQDYKVSA